MEGIEIIKIAANAINEKKGREISVIKIGDLTVLTDYFVLCTANSSTQVRALCDEVEDKLKENGVLVRHFTAERINSSKPENTLGALTETSK